ncbi:MAG: hypothetical protein ACKVY0_26945 [Prosthecobacter sp.]|uniref:hypothetical protein n=1 Tax=Prosthecobacter sp. TaxID=1965333 RepID=UPI0039044EC2
MQPPPGASPFQIGGSPLFKTAGNEPIAAPPINSTLGMSPFSIAGATPTNAPLTVGDVINQLPPEVVRAGALPLEQPLSLPPALLENALRSGQAALPVFELYRVCPALFQVPISPQDPRLVPLPAAKLPGLIAQAREGQGAENAPAPPALSAPSPFSFAQPAAASAPVASPFQMAPPAAEAAAATAQAFPMSPFAAASPAFTAPEPAPAPSPSPFSIKPAAEAPPATPFGMMSAPGVPLATPFSFGSAAGGSPFGMPQQAASPFSAAAPTASPASFSPAPAAPQLSITGLFTPKSQENAATPAAMSATAPAMPFGSPFAAAMKEASPQAEPAPTFAPPPQSFAHAAPAAMPGHAASASGVAKLGFAALLNGYSVEELGFNPAVVPAWITTSVAASTLQEQISSGSVIVELGTLIDGVSDLGFRNTLATAKRDFRVRLPQNEVFHALTSLLATPAAAPSPFGNQAAPAPRPVAPANNFTIQPGAPSGQVDRVEMSPPASFAAPAMPSFASPPAPQNPLSVFAAPPMAETPAPASSSLTPKFGAALNPFAQSQPPAAPASISAFGSAQQPGAPSPFAFTSPTAAEPALPTWSQPAPAAPPQKAPASQPLFPTVSQVAAAAPLQPLAGAFQPFGAQPSLFASQPPLQASPLSPTTKPFDPFAASSTGSLAAKAPPESGFSSAQLLGQAAPSVFAPPPAPEVNRAVGPFAEPALESFKPMPSFAPALDEMPAIPQPPAPASRGLFSTQPASAPLFAEPAPQPRPEPKPTPAFAPAAAAPAKMTAVKHSFLGLAPLDTQTDQLLLRALLGTEEKLAAPRVVELLAGQTGLSACVCLHGSHVLSHADSSKADAVEFQRQAPDIARQLRGLAPLIGIEGAETFTLNAGGRLLTFCFPGDTIIGVLHDDEPSTGLRDKITLIGRELARMLG